MIDLTNLFESMTDFFNSHQKEFAVGAAVGLGIGFTCVCYKAITNNYVLEAGSNASFIKMAPAETIEKLRRLEDK